MGIFTHTKNKNTHETQTVSDYVSTPATVKAGVVASSVILAPHVTEKSAHLASQSQYVFRVAVKANKIQIAQAIRAMYGVVPTSVNIQNFDGKKVRYGRTKGERKNWKKAIVSLPEGKTIEVYEGV